MATKQIPPLPASLKPYLPSEGGDRDNVGGRRRIIAVQPNAINGNGNGTPAAVVAATTVKEASPLTQDGISKKWVIVAFTVSIAVLVVVIVALSVRLSEVEKDNENEKEKELLPPATKRSGVLQSVVLERERGERKKATEEQSNGRGHRLSVNNPYVPKISSPMISTEEMGFSTAVPLSPF